MQKLRCETMANGLVKVFDHATIMTAVYNPDGTYRHGDLRGCETAVREHLDGLR